AHVVPRPIKTGPERSPGPAPARSPRRALVGGSILSSTETLPELRAIPPTSTLTIFPVFWPREKTPPPGPLSVSGRGAELVFLPLSVSAGGTRASGSAGGGVCRPQSATG